MVCCTDVPAQQHEGSQMHRACLAIGRLSRRETVSADDVSVEFTETGRQNHPTECGRNPLDHNSHRNRLEWDRIMIDLDPTTLGLEFGGGALIGGIIGFATKRSRSCSRSSSASN